MIRWAVARPIAVAMLFLGVVLIGALSYRRLPVDLLPSIDYPRLTVVTNDTDVPADDLTRLVTRPLEERITGLAGVRRVVSRTRQGVSTITVVYNWGTDMEFAVLHLREAVDQVAGREDFPEDAERPLILRWDPGARPIAVVALAAGNAPGRQTEFARDVVKPALEQIAGISQAEVIGGADREILVRPDLSRLRLYGLTMDDLSRALALANIDFPGGRIRKGPLHLPLRILGQFQSLDDIRATEIPGTRGRTLTVGDVAAVVDTTKEPQGVTLLGQQEVVALLLYKEVGANTIAATDEVDRVLGILQSQYPDFRYRYVVRDADYVRESFRGLKDSLLGGAVLALLVLILFLRDPRSPLVVGLSIPVSVMATFALMYFAGVDINLMSLGGLSLAAGMLVDNAIVVLENTKRHLADLPANGDVPGTCARAAGEVAGAVTAATLTTVAVFFPVVYVPGIAGAFFRDQALTVTVALLVSIATALLLQPSLSARLLRAGPERSRGLLSRFADVFDRTGEAYHAFLERVLEHKVRFLLLLAAGMTVTVVVALELPRSFLPARSGGDFTVALELPAGTPLAATATVAADLAATTAALPEVATVFSQVGRTERTLAALKEYTAPNTVRMRVLLHPSRHGAARMRRVKAELRRWLAGHDDLVAVFRDEGVGLREILASGEAPFTLGVTAEHPADALTVTERLLPLLAGIDGLTGLSMDRVLGNPAVEVTIDRDLALRHGLDPDVLARELQARIQGVVATTYDEIDQRIDVAVRLPVTQRRDLDAVLASPVRLEGGRSIPLADFVHLRETRPVREVVRRDQRRQVTISGDVSGRRLGHIWRDVQAVLDTLTVPAGVGFVTGGEQQEIDASFRDLGWALLLSALLVYMILAAQFESLLDPLIVSTVLPVGILGGLLALALAGQSINIVSLIGMAALLGISVNDAIVKVDTISRLRRREGLPLRAAILTASRLRFRPIVMTTLTTVLAMIPMAIGIGSGEQMQRPLALTILGGLTIATVVTLFLTPVTYELAHRRRDGREETV